MSSESSREKKDVWEENFKALRHYTIVGEGLEETLRDLQKHATPSTHAFIIISDSEEEQVEDKAIEKVE
jgi:hypothetical protein